MGGYVTLAFAEKYQRKLKGFTLFHSHAMADTAEARQNRDRTIKLVRQDKKDYIRNFMPLLFDPQNVNLYQEEIGYLKSLADSMSKEAIIAALEGMKIRPDRTHVLVQSKMPIQFIIGKNDTRLPLHAVMPQTILPAISETLVLDKVGHMGIIEAREETFKALQHFAMKVL